MTDHMAKGSMFANPKDVAKDICRATGEALPGNSVHSVEMEIHDGHCARYSGTGVQALEFLARLAQQELRRVVNYRIVSDLAATRIISDATPTSQVTQSPAA